MNHEACEISVRRNFEISSNKQLAAMIPNVFALISQFIILRKERALYESM